MPEAPFQHLSCPVIVLRVVPHEVRGDVLGSELHDEALRLHANCNATNVVIDFTAVTFLSSAGIRPLLALQRLVKERGGRLVLCNLHPAVREVLDVTRMLRSSGITTLDVETSHDVPSAVARLYDSASAPASGG
jgi:anti-anti-sigma factor